MNAVDLCVFLTSFNLIVAFVAVGELFRFRRVSSVVCVVIALAAIAATVVVGSYVKRDTSYLGLLWFLWQERDFSAAVAWGLGAAAALVWIPRLIDRSRTADDANRKSSIRQLIGPVVLAASILGVALSAQLFMWKEIKGVRRDPIARVHAPGFIIEQVAKLDFLPIRVATSDEGRVYVSYDYFEDSGTIGGGIVELVEDGETGKFLKKTVADSPLLMRCNGLVARNGALFVSRSGFWAQANQGHIEYANAGAITQLRDINGDGYFEYTHDVVKGLPGVRGPVTIHQNSGFAFAPDGHLFVLTASAANRSLSVHEWEGAVLRISPDFSHTEVFARGFRNPFGIVFGPDNELFVSDNDIDENPGDELNHVVGGAHYGHPYVVPHDSVESAGFRDPILVGEHDWNFLGMTFATAKELPEPYRDCIYVADFMQNGIHRLKLEPSGDTYKVTTVEKFATISSPVDIATNAAGELFVVSRRTKNVYRIRPRR